MKANNRMQFQQTFSPALNQLFRAIMEMPMDSYPTEGSDLLQNSDPLENIKTLLSGFEAPETSADSG